MRWDRVPPPEPCTSPDGHSPVDCRTFGSYVAAHVRCDRCGRLWQVVAVEEDV